MGMTIALLVATIVQAGAMIWGDFDSHNANMLVQKQQQASQEIIVDKRGNVFKKPQNLQQQEPQAEEQNINNLNK